MLFKIDTNDQLVACNSSWNPKELDLERYIVNTADSETPFLSSRVFGEELLVVSNQVKTRTKKRADILAVDRNGNGVVVELKRDEGKLGVETQALQYLSDFSRYRGGQFVQQFGSRQSDLHGNIAGFLGSDVDIENLNSAMRVILLARGFDQSVYSIGEWLSSKGVSFKCMTYWPVELHNEHYLSFSVAFDRSETSIHQFRFAPTAREPGIFWHNIARADQNWWEFLVQRGQIPACFENSPTDHGARIMSGYVPGDRVIAYAKGYGAVGWGIIEEPEKYTIIPKGDADDRMQGDCRHRTPVKWQSTAPRLSDGVAPNVVRTHFGVYHPISTCVSIDDEKGEALIQYLDQQFSP